MLSVKEARKSLKDGDKLPDEDVAPIRDGFRTLAEFVFEQYQRNRKKQKSEQWPEAKT